jgi:hypothetical protein
MSYGPNVVEAIETPGFMLAAFSDKLGNLLVTRCSSVWFQTVRSRAWAWT